MYSYRFLEIHQFLFTCHDHILFVGYFHCYFPGLELNITLESAKILSRRERNRCFPLGWLNKLTKETYGMKYDMKETDW